MRAAILSVAFLCICFLSYSQNLVPNPGFEEYSRCPGGHSERKEEFRVHGWTTVNAGTPDHFHACSVGDADVPYNWAGISDAFEGEGYVGIYAWMNSGRDYREYIQCQLTSPMIRDTLYRVSFRYKLSSYSKYSIDRMGLLLSDSAVRFRCDRAPNLKPTFQALQDSALTERTGSWELGSWEYRAAGNEAFVTIGNFFDDATTHNYEIKFRTVQQDMLKSSAYYYLDEVIVEPVYGEGLTQQLPGFTPAAVALNTTYVLRNIQFEFDSYKLLATSFDELDDLARYVIANPRLRIRLSGHTDDQGGTKYNLQLSENRARTVGKYLQAQGIAADRIQASGFGKDKPLVNEKTEEARKQNRRVEILFLQ